jgi:hypothetical protein
MLLDTIGRAHGLVGAITIMGSGRLGPTITALLGFTAAGLGARALARGGRRDELTSPERGSQWHAPLLLGIPAVVLGGVFLAAADGGPGTGNGVVASGAAIVLGCLAIMLDRLAARRWRRSPG